MAQTAFANDKLLFFAFPVFWCTEVPLQKRIVSGEGKFGWNLNIDTVLLDCYENGRLIS